MKNIELILIGSELLNGKTQDLNTSILTKAIAETNLSLKKVHIIEDLKDSFESSVHEASSRSDIVIISGGLGPTQDDLTKSMLAGFFDKEIIESAKANEVTKSHYARNKKEYDTKSNLYRFIPKDFSPISNPIGFAPGLSFKAKNVEIFALPGVPREFQQMLKLEVLPNIIEKDREYVKLLNYRSRQVAESKIFNELCPTLWKELEEFGEVSSLPNIMGVDIGVKIKYTNTEEVQVIKKEVDTLIYNSNIAHSVWSEGFDLLEEVIIQKAVKKGLKIGFAESCTGGLLGHRLTNVSGSSAVFWGSIVSYSNEVKMNALNVSSESLKNFGAVSDVVAKEMAIGAKSLMNVDIAITTTGIAGPGGGSEFKPVGTVGIGIKTRNKESGEIFNFHGDRETLKKKFAELALFKLLDEINSY